MPFNKKYFYRFLSIVLISSFLSPLSNASKEEVEEERFYSSFFKAAESLYDYRTELEKTPTFQMSSMVDLFVFSPLYNLYTKGPFSAAVNLSLSLGLNPNFLPNVGKKFVDRFAPECLKPSCHTFLSGTSYLISGYQLYHQGTEFIISNLVGLMGIGIAHSIVNSFRIEESPIRRECEAFAYYCLKRAGWHYAEDLYDRAQNLLSYVPAYALNLLFLDFQVVPGVKGEIADRVSQTDTTVLEQCPVDVNVHECLTDVCRIENGWNSVKRCIQARDPEEGYGFYEWSRCRYSSYNDKIPTFEQDKVDPLYSGIKIIGAGGANIIFEATLQQERPNHGLKKGDKIAVRFSGLREFLYPDFDGYSRLDMVRPYTNSFTETYGVYFGPLIDPLKASVWNPSAFVGKKSLYVEMEHIPFSFFDSYHDRPGEIKGIVPDSVLFELCIGEWSLGSMAGVYIGDYKGRHFGYKLSDALRVYEIGNKNFLMDSPMIPKRLDYDDTVPVNLQCSIEAVAEQCRVFSMFKDNLSPRLADLYKNNKNLGVFPFLFKAFEDYEISDLEVLNLKQNNTVNLEYYKLPEDLLPRDAFLDIKS